MLPSLDKNMGSKGEIPSAEFRISNSYRPVRSLLQLASVSPCPTFNGQTKYVHGEIESLGAYLSADLSFICHPRSLHSLILTIFLLNGMHIDIRGYFGTGKRRWEIAAIHERTNTFLALDASEIVVLPSVERMDLRICPLKLIHSSSFYYHALL
ncbi:hypothetical protein DKX38_017358 [Salix brachista]|uniref:Uncharacterized protein n=1 Tax=Salix brachista TaxID=2182728 RepID=A0A5N5KV72_9ROSI|nr:hypothetical protein DKX38_017358 [Salix brachista]